MIENIPIVIYMLGAGIEIGSRYPVFIAEVIPHGIIKKRKVLTFDPAVQFLCNSARHDAMKSVCAYETWLKGIAV